MNKLIIMSLFTSLIISSCSSQKVTNDIQEQNTEFVGVKTQEFTPGVFIKNGIGYQGSTESEIKDLPEFVVNNNGINATKAINDAITLASNSIINGKAGGKVILESGVYVVKDIILKSNVHIRLQKGVVLEADQTNANKYHIAKLVFDVGKNNALENVSIVGEGQGNNRPIIRYKRESDEIKKGGARAFSIGGVKNLFIQNIIIQDEQTRFSGVAFSFRSNDFSDSGRANQVTVDHVTQINASYGYGLIQANAGKNMLFSNLVCSGGVCARIETDNRYSQSKFGVDNIVVKNVISIKGKAGVYLNPHTIANGDVHIDGVHAIQSQMAIEIRPGYLDTTGNGRYGVNSTIKNVTAEYGLNSTVHFAGKKSIPKCLLPYFKDDVLVDAENKGVRQGPSICVIGDYVGDFIIDIETVSASLPENETNPDNNIKARKTIVTTEAYRGADTSKFCGAAAYE